MNKVDLNQALKDSNHLSKSEAEMVINLFFDKMATHSQGTASALFKGCCVVWQIMRGM